MSPFPEREARQHIDAALEAAGWAIQDRATMNLTAAPGIAVREFRMVKGHGFADYLLFVNQKAVGALEAKPAGYRLANVELQAGKYATGLPDGLNPPVDPLPFLYLSTGVETRFINGLDPDPKTRAISANLSHIHRPETLAEWIAAETLDEWVKRLHAEGTGFHTAADDTKPASFRARLETLPLSEPHLPEKGRGKRSVRVGPLGKFAGLAVAASAAALACGSTAPEAAQLRGNFAATYFVGEVQVTVAVGLQATDGVVSGAGWTNMNDSLMGGAVLSGSYSPPNIQFSFEPRLGGATVWHFFGTVDPQGISIPGEFALAPGTGFPMTLLPVDTIPTGEYRLTLSNPAQVLSGSAVFNELDLGQPRLYIGLQTHGAEQYYTVFGWDDASLPPIGTFQLSDPGAPEVYFAEPSGIQYEYGPGTITIELAQRYVIAGRYTVTVRNPSSGQSRLLEATFSAGCSGSGC